MPVTASLPPSAAAPSRGAAWVLLPRPEGRGGELARLLREQGLHVEQHPVVELRLHHDAPMREAVTALAAGQWEHLVLTSPRAVEALAAVPSPLPEGTDAADAGPMLQETGSAEHQPGVLRIPASVTVTVVGEGTASALRACGREPDRVAGGSGQALVEQFPPAPDTGARVLFPASAAAASTVPDGLAANGYALTRVTAYTPHPLPLPPQVAHDLRTGVYRVVVLTSSMIARILAEQGVHPSTRVVTIGDPSTAAARAAGLTVHHQARTPTDRGLADAVRAALSDPSDPSDSVHQETPMTSDPTAPRTPRQQAPDAAVGGPVPIVRPRRLRTTGAMRSLVREHTLRPADLVLPMFVREGITEDQPISSMPGVLQHTEDSLVRAATEATERGVGGLMLFGVPKYKDAVGSGATDPDGVLNRALARLRRELGDATVIMADLCLDEFTDHGHCGVLDAEGRVDNDATLGRYREMALAQAEAGAHLLGPSGMMDGQIAAIREALDAAGHVDVGLYAYTAKYASAFFGPFRDAVGSSLSGDRRTYQQDPANGREALRELELDVAEGADLVMVKPGLPYLDVLAEVAAASPVPVGAYQVSGEYAMVEAAAANGWIDRDKVILESLLAFRRAGATTVLTYWASEVAGWYRDGLPAHLREFL